MSLVTLCDERLCYYLGIPFPALRDSCFNVHNLRIPRHETGKTQAGDFSSVHQHIAKSCLQEIALALPEQIYLGEQGGGFDF